jgi:very-short-patch-repair endonuclease
VDGGYHNEIRDIDANRDETLLVQLGIRTLRIENEELINMPAVINKIIAFINTLGPPQSY